MQRIAFLALTVCSLMAATSQAALFSFASDDNADGPTFRGVSTTVDDAAPFDFSGTIDIDFLVDLNHDAPGGTVTFAGATFEFLGFLTGYTGIPFGGAVVHNWTIGDAMYKIKDATGADILTATFNNALMTSFSPSPTTMGQTATIQGNDMTDASLTFTAGPALTAATGLTDDQLSVDKNFAFTLTDVDALFLGGPVPLTPAQFDQQLLIPAVSWTAEGSHSAEATPEPASLALLGLGGLLIARRRR